MAGTIITDKIQTENSFLTLNVGQTLVATINSSGILNSSGGIMVGANGSVSNTAITGFINGTQLAANTVANSNIQTGSVEAYMRSVNLDFGLRNRIINGTMAIDQRNAGANVSLSSSENFVTDRYIVQTATGSGNIGAQSSTAPAGFVNSLRVRIGTGASPSSANLNSIFQIVEGTNCADLKWGTADARPVTLSFQVRSTVTGTFSGSLRNYAGNRSYPFTYTINSANTWENETITIAGDTAGSWNSNTSGGIIVFFDLGSGSNSQGTAGAWAAGDRRAATGSTQLVATSGAEFFITGVQLEEGLQQTPFEYRQFGTELALCQRYFYKMSGGSQYIRIGTGPANETTAALITVFMQTPMRATPSSLTQTGALGLWAGATVFSVSATAVVGDSSSPFTAVVSSTTTGLTVGTTYQLIGNNSAAASIGLSAEL
jgi:hypothetical protein